MSDSEDVSMSDAESESTGPPSISIPDPPTLPALFEDDPEGRWAKTRNPHNLEAERIHPVFRKDMFRNITDAGYELMLPAILLANAWLDDPTTLNFFHGVWATEQHTSYWDLDLGHCTIVHIPQTLSEYSQRETHEKIVAMRNWISWRIVDGSELADRGALASTETLVDDNDKPIPASAPYTHQSQIHLSKFTLELLRLFDQHVSTESQEYKKKLEDTLDFAGIPDSHKFEHFDLYSAIMRTYLLMANNMIHEFAHAFSSAYYNNPDWLFAGGQAHKEPWVAGNYNNEMGYSLVKHVLGENPYASIIWRIPMSYHEKNLQATLCPFGLFTPRRWDAGRGKKPDVKEFVLPGLPVHRARECPIFYPLPQKHVNAISTKEMWTKHVPRYGLAALRLPQPLKWGAM
ncbi:hypothetical protein KCU71_g11538, partial [Aureobasidium melanogenum]